MSANRENVNVSSFNSRDNQYSLDKNKRNSNISGETRSGLPAPCKASQYIISGTRDPNGEFYPHFKVFCKTYDCEYCGPRKIALLKWSIALAIERFRLTVFATLTLDPKTCPVISEESDLYIRRVWNKFRILQKREFDRGVEFIAVLEFQKNGYAHLHVLFDEYIPHDWLREAWPAVGGGKIVDVRRADKGASGYMAKYLSKGLSGNDRRRKHRRYSTSKGISLNRLFKESLEGRSVKFRFCKIGEEEARDILKPYLLGDIIDPKGFVTGFMADRQLNPAEATEGKCQSC